MDGKPIKYGVYPSPVVLAPSIVGDSCPAKTLSFALASPASAVESVLLLSVTANIAMTATIAYQQHSHNCCLPSATIVVVRTLSGNSPKKTVCGYLICNFCLELLENFPLLAKNLSPDSCLSLFLASCKWMISPRNI